MRLKKGSKVNEIFMKSQMTFMALYSNMREKLQERIGKAKKDSRTLREKFLTGAVYHCIRKRLVISSPCFRWYAWMPRNLAVSTCTRVSSIKRVSAGTRFFSSRIKEKIAGSGFLRPIRNENQAFSKSSSKSL